MVGYGMQNVKKAWKKASVGQEVPQGRAQMQKKDVYRSWKQGWAVLEEYRAVAWACSDGDRKASQSWQSGEVPGDWKKANITLGTKKDEDPGNYGQISLTLVPGIVKEQIILETFYEKKKKKGKK